MMMKKTTGTLTDILKKTNPDKVGHYIEENAEEMFFDPRPFSAYMRSLIREKGVRLQDVFLLADISEGYGYKLISGEKHTKQRDVILKLCLSAGFSLVEIQRALKLYGMSPLYARFPRDAVLISAVSSGIMEIAQVNRLLEQNGQQLLKGSEEM